ncbi:MAG: hypothetical protein AAF744_04515 [Pseudomonadota bacterium]
MKTRFIKSATETAAKTDVQMPWTRGARRAVFIAKRRLQEPARKSA